MNVRGGIAGALVAGALVFACGRGPSAKDATSPTGGPEARASAPAPLPPHVPLPVPKDAPVNARFVTAPAQLEEAVCKRTFLAATRGVLEVDGRTLRPGDVLVMLNAAALDVTGKGEAVFASVDVPPSTCGAKARPAPFYTLVAANEARELVWGHGTMSAHLDVERERAPEAYVGRLSGTAAVAEHAHAGAWEVLFILDAAGTFTVNGEAHRVAANDIVFVPAGAKHAWVPDPGTKLDAVQMYVPPGPEQRFRALAQVDAGL